MKTEVFEEDVGNEPVLIGETPDPARATGRATAGLDISC